MKASEKPIIVEEKFDEDVDTVWAALTEPEQMRKWFFDNIPDFKPEVGFMVEFDVDAGERHFLHQWKVLRAVPKKLIEVNWRYEGYAGNAIVSFGLEQLGSQTKLTLTNTVTEDFTEGIPEFERESCIGGWRYFIQQRLKEYLEHP